jgi:hypothetical protein
MTARGASGWEPHHVSRLIITVEVDSGPDTKTYTEIHHFAEGLLRNFDSQNIAATWALRDVRETALVPALIRSGSAQELAVLGDRSWIGAGATRRRFQSVLAHKVEAARGTGLRVRSLVPTVAGASAHTDLLINQGIAAVAGTGRESQRAAQFSTPRTLHWGLWELPIAARFPAAGWLSNRKVWWRLKQAIADYATFHLVVDVGELAKQRNNWALRTLERLGDLRNRGLVQIETLGTLAERMSSSCQPQGQRSILRPGRVAA